jgi:hypothetical protein
MLILYKVDILIISFKCNLFLSVARLALNNKSLLHHVLIHDIWSIYLSDDTIFQSLWFQSGFPW